MIFVATILSIMLFFDIYFYQGLKVVISNLKPGKRKRIKQIYWLFTAMVILFLAISILRLFEWPRFFKIYFTSLVIILTVSKIFATIPLLIDDIIRIFRWIGKRTYSFSRPPATRINKDFRLGRMKFLSNMAMFIAAIPFFHMFYGMLKGAFNYTVHNNKVFLPNLPKAFEGLKIVQLSDIHCGSFLSTEPLETAVKMINELKADVVFFTGDLVNDLTEETDRFVEILGKIKAPMGIFSVLGNHDYADYVNWSNVDKKKENFNQMINRQRKDLGWNLLMNENKILEKNGEKLAVVGVENIGKSDRFPKYGDLKKALKGTEEVNCKLLLSHDPYHWDSEVSNFYPEIDITFSGHTHGMQFGVELPWLKWSPVQYVYNQWAGLYNKGKQYVYINRGLGFIGYAGRAGIWPEITLHELYSGK